MSLCKLQKVCTKMTKLTDVHVLCACSYLSELHPLWKAKPLWWYTGFEIIVPLFAEVLVIVDWVWSNTVCTLASTSHCFHCTPTECNAATHPCKHCSLLLSLGWLSCERLSKYSSQHIMPCRQHTFWVTWLYVHVHVQPTFLTENCGLIYTCIDITILCCILSV